MSTDNNSEKQIIEGIPNLIWGTINDKTDDLTVISALKLCLDKIGEKYSKVYLAGTSCAAFFTGWRADSLQSGMGGGVFQFPEHAEPGFANLFNIIGRKYIIINRSNPELLWSTAVNSINNDTPVVCVEWLPWQNRGHFAILTGYNRKKKEFFGRNYSFNHYKEYIPLKPENINYIIIIGEKIKKESSNDKSALKTLRLALQMSKTGIKSGEETGAYGLIAYEKQAQMMLTQMDPNLEVYPLLEHFLFWRLEVLGLCRNYAILYLDRIAKEFNQSEKEFILSAKKNYQEFIKYFDGKLKFLSGKEAEKWGTPLLWCNKGKEQPVKTLFSNLKGRKLFSEFLLTLQKYEKEFYENINKLFIQPEI